MVNILLVVIRIWLVQNLGRRYIRKRTGGLARKVAKALSRHGKYIACCNTYLVSAEFRKALYPQADKWV